MKKFRTLEKMYTWNGALVSVSREQNYSSSCPSPSRVLFRVHALVHVPVRALSPFPFRVPYPCPSLCSHVFSMHPHFCCGYVCVSSPVNFLKNFPNSTNSNLTTNSIENCFHCSSSNSLNYCQNY